MTHRRKSGAVRRIVDGGLAAAEDAVNDRRLIANLFATWHRSRCGRVTCQRALTCAESDVPCFQENLEELRDALLDLAGGDLFAGLDDDGDGDTG